ncbi:unnamed protein product [Echinostoma caproni]|uniref:CCDC66 domain-containing protein n=1 Tax=Echinostoma caproni TaxID=27848 RepID=A0A183AWB5_9TREM|nr:unnamed protein product [Echinostoma caproni]
MGPSDCHDIPVLGVVCEEEQRRQWKAELDKQVLEQRMLKEKIRLEEQRKTEAILNQMRLQQLSVQPLASNQSPLGTAVLSTNTLTHPVVGPVAPHPSASHFTNTAFLPTAMLVPNSVTGVSVDPALTTGVSAPILSNSLVPTESSQLTGMQTTPVPATLRTGFNRTRGFTQQMYFDSAENAERARLAYEARMENLRQIEEKQRRKEAEKAKILIEEKLEEERLARERAQMEAVAQAENAERIKRESYYRALNELV